MEFILDFFIGTVTSLRIFFTSKAASQSSSSSIVSATFKMACVYDVYRDQGFLPTGFSRLTMLKNFCAAEYLRPIDRNAKTMVRFTS